GYRIALALVDELDLAGEDRRGDLDPPGLLLLNGGVLVGGRARLLVLDDDVDADVPLAALLSTTLDDDFANRRQDAADNALLALVPAGDDAHGITHAQAHLARE